MASSFVNDSGKSIEIGSELGAGGEGSVYEVISNQSLVAKLYKPNHQPDALKQAKLRFMSRSANKDLLSYAAWPQETLHKTENGPVVGFLMPKISGRVPIHILYSPAHRRQEYPNAAWDFLLFNARNTAAAFAAIHHYGHVIGDVNQGNVLVGADSKVVLIDADSFQITADRTTHLCKVGVAHFTPPELQGGANFDRAPRTANHDNFGLALLIFHLLFGGRHPYSGVPLRSDTGEALEKDIQAFRYAYAMDGQRRGFSPPPKSIPISTIPEAVQAMFTLAFTEEGSNGKRPTAQQWVTALDGLRSKLKKCVGVSTHIYSGHLAKCPWCALEDQGVIYFLDVKLGVNSVGANGFILARVWASIESISAPPEIIIPDVSSIVVKPAHLLVNFRTTICIVCLRFITFCAGLLFVVAKPGASFLIILIAWFVWKIAGELGEGERSVERLKRKSDLDTAQKNFNQVVARIRQEVNMQAFEIKKQELAKLRDEYQNLPEREKIEMANLHASVEARQKNHFLDQHFIDVATISGVGLTKKAALRSFGIETAADVSWDSVRAVKGFGDVLTRAVVDWRKGLERRFVFNPNLSVTEGDKIKLRATILSRKRAIEFTLTSGVNELQAIRQGILSKHGGLNSALQMASLKLAQAKADLSAI
jgi:DNA-binding helix-hairpin-helix protein with protein kinase domain